jgi:hypothetical protein
MDESRTFGSLVAELPLSERKILLEKLSSHSTLPKEIPEDKEDNSISILLGERNYNRLPWYLRLSCLILSIFRGTSPLRIFENRQIVLIGQWINEKTPGIYDYRRELLLPAMQKKLLKLKEAARFFYNVLDQSINQDKGAFYAFLGSLEMEDVHSRLNEGTDPALFVTENTGAAEMELRQTALANLERGLALISEDEKDLMYANARSLNCLKALSTFHFDRLILHFTANPAFQGPVCAAGTVKDQLITLQNVLFSLKHTPSIALLESLFIFTLQEQPRDKKTDITMEMQRLLAQAEKSLTVIRNFNQEVSLTQVIRCCCRNFSLHPQDISGGEEWFFVYRDYWKRYVDERFTQYIEASRYQELVNSIELFFPGIRLRTLNEVFSESNPYGFPVKGSLCLSFLLTFYSVVFVDKINRFLEPILLDGIFYSRENQTFFTENYRGLMNMENIIEQFQVRISPSGEFGRRYAIATMDKAAPSFKRHKSQGILDEANGMAFQIIANVQAAMDGTIKILGKILKTTAEGKYDVLLNMAQLAGKGTVFITGLTESLSLLKESLRLLTDINEVVSKSNGPIRLTRETGAKP